MICATPQKVNLAISCLLHTPLACVIMPKTPIVNNKAAVQSFLEKIFFAIQRINYCIFVIVKSQLSISGKLLHKCFCSASSLIVAVS